MYYPHYVSKFAFGDGNDADTKNVNFTDRQTFTVLSIVSLSLFLP